MKSFSSLYLFSSSSHLTSLSFAFFEFLPSFSCLPGEQAAGIVIMHEEEGTGARRRHPLVCH